jgi:hypothetical protein
MRGGRKPWVLLDISTLAEASGAAVPIPTPAELLKILLLFTTHCEPFQ